MHVYDVTDDEKPNGLNVKLFIYFKNLNTLPQTQTHEQNKNFPHHVYDLQQSETQLHQDGC